jgi:transposase InsO family protein
LPTERNCRFACLTRWATHKASQHALDDEDLVVRVKALHAKARRGYGSPRVHGQLAREGVKVSRKRVARLMRREGIVGRRKRRHKATTKSKHENPLAPNLLNRKFPVEEFGRVMVGDTTAIEARRGFLYLALLTDLCMRAVVGWSMSERNDKDHVLEALRMAQKRGFPRGFIHHSDRGSTYTCADYRKAVEQSGGALSMSRKGDCLDNAVAESVFRTVTEEAIGTIVPDSPEHAQTLIFSDIEGFDNSERLHSTSGHLTPNEFETIKKDGLSKNVKSATLSVSAKAGQVHLEAAEAAAAAASREVGHRWAVRPPRSRGSGEGHAVCLLARPRIS